MYIQAYLFFIKKFIILSGPITSIYDVLSGGQKTKTQIENKDNQRQTQEISINVRVLGEGSFGKVVETLDVMTGQFIAKKTIKDHESYVIECEMYKKLIQTYLKEDKLQLLQGVCILPNNQENNDDEGSIRFPAGDASLDDVKKIHSFKFTRSQLMHIFMQALELILLLKEQGYCHSDIKPQNIALVRVPGLKDYYQAKIIDFGGLTQNDIDPPAYTPAYFLSPLRTKVGSQFVKFADMKERYKNEFYTVIRTLQNIILGSDEKDFFLKKQEKEQQIDHLKNLNELLRQVKGDAQKEFNLLVDFIRQQGIEEKYEFQELNNLLITIKNVAKLQKNVKYFHDPEQFIAKFVKSKTQQATSRESAISWLFGLENYVYQQGSLKSDYLQPFKLLEVFKEGVLSDDEAHQTVVLYGEGGAGKSLFLTKLLKELYNDKRFNDFFIVYLRLRDLSGLSQSEKQLDKITESIDKEIKKIRSQEQYKAILLLLDGFDELNNKKISIKQRIEQQYGKIIKIIVTSRPSYAMQDQFVYCFGRHLDVYMCPFDNKQKILYIKNSVLAFHKLKLKLRELEVFQTAEEYISYLQRNKALSDLSKLPFTLSLILTILPKLQKQQSQQQSLKALTRYDIYEKFIQNYAESEMQRILSIDQNVEILDSHYNINKEASIKINNGLQKTFLEDVQIFHQMCSWKMLQKQELLLNNSDIDEVIQQLSVTTNSSNTNIKFIQIKSILCKIAPVCCQQYKEELVYMHKSIYEFFIAQIILKETQEAKGKALDEEKSMLGHGFLAFDLDILSFVGDYVSEQSVSTQYAEFFETWYNSVLLTQKIKFQQIKNEQKVLKLKRIGSNSINLLAAMPHCDLTDRAFCSCAMPYAYLYKRDLSKCRFNGSDLINCTLTDCLLDDCVFLDTDLSNLKYGRFPDLIGHLDDINCIAFSPDGQCIASGSSDKTVKLWCTQTKREIATLNGHEKSVLSISFSLDSKWIASGSADQMIKLWDFKLKTEFFTLAGHTGCVNSVAFSPDGKFLASGSSDSTIKLWDVYQTLNEVATIKSYTGEVYQVAFSPDAKYLATCGLIDHIITASSVVNLWSTDTKQNLYWPKLNLSGTASIAFSPDGKYIAVGSYSNHFININEDTCQIQLVPIDQNQQRFSLQGDFKDVHDVAFSPDGKYLAFTCSDLSIKFWCLEKYKQINSMVGHTSDVKAITFSPDSKYIVSGSSDKTIKLWNLEVPTELLKPSTLKDEINQIMFSGDGKLLLTSGYTRNLYEHGCKISVWCIESQKEISEILIPIAPLSKIQISQQGHYIAFSVAQDFGLDGLISKYNHNIKLWSVESEKNIATLKGHDCSVYSVSFSPCSKQLLSGGEDLSINLWSLEDKKIIATLKGHKSCVIQVAFSGDGNCAISYSEDSIILIWHLKGVYQLKYAIQNQFEIHSVAISQDSQQILSYDVEGYIKIYRANIQIKQYQLVANFQAIPKLKAPGYINFSQIGLYSLCFHAFNTQGCKIWNADSNKALFLLNMDNEELKTFALSPDTLQIAYMRDQNEITLQSRTQPIDSHKIQNNQSQALPMDQLKMRFKQRIQSVIQFGRKVDKIFRCQDAVFQNCTFTDRKEADEAKMFFEQYKCRQFSTPKLLN